MKHTSPQSSTSHRHLAPTPLGYEDDVFSQSELNEVRTSFHSWDWEATTNVVAEALTSFSLAYNTGQVIGDTCITMQVEFIPHGQFVSVIHRDTTWEPFISSRVLMSIDAARRLYRFLKSRNLNDIN